MADDARPMPPHVSTYTSYVLRIWHDAAESGWQATVHDVRDGAQTHFTTPAALLDYLAACVQAQEGPADPRT